MEIDHDPHERRPDNRIWWVLWPIIAFCWVVFYWNGMIDWRSVALGGFTAGVLATWAIEITGNKVPDSWRGKPPGS
jgi:hypothetical protein